MRPRCLALASSLLLSLGCGPSVDPGDGPPPGAPAAEAAFREAVLGAHDAVRSGASPTPQPALPALTWSESAAGVAQRWVALCRFEHNPNRGSLGENLYATSRAADVIADVVRSWSDEAPHYDYATNTCADGKVCGHYTQLVWRATTQVGCAVEECGVNSPFGTTAPWYLWVCNYAPAGNVVGQRPY